MTILISNRSRHAIPTCEMSDEQAGSLNKACSDYRSSHSLAISERRGAIRLLPLLFSSRRNGDTIAGQAGFAPVQLPTLEPTAAPAPVMRAGVIFCGGALHVATSVRTSGCLLLSENRHPQFASATLMQA